MVTPIITPQQILSSTNRVGINDALMMFEFKPSMGITAQKIDKLGLDIRSFREPLKRCVQQVMAPSFKRNFDAQGRPDSWTPLSEATLAIRQSMGVSGSTILQRSGLLRRTIQQLNIWTITPTTATIQNLPPKVWYGTIHQGGYGGKGTGKKMSGRIKAAGGDIKAATRSLDDDLIMAMRSGQRVGGGERTVSSIPQRQFVMVQDEDYDGIQQVFETWMTERALAAGLLVT